MPADGAELLRLGIAIEGSELGNFPKTLRKRSQESNAKNRVWRHLTGELLSLLRYVYCRVVLVPVYYLG